MGLKKDSEREKERTITESCIEDYYYYNKQSKMKRSLALVALGSICSLLLVAGQQQQQQSQQQSQQPAHQEVRQAPNHAAAAASLQAHLNAIQQQAQRHMGLMLNAAANLSGVASQPSPLSGGAKFSPVLEALSSVGKAIQQQIAQPVHLVGEQPANNKKNEYFGSELETNSSQPAPSANNYREQGEVLRQEIVKRAGQLQQVVASSMELVKNNGDLIVRRLLDQMNVRLDQAKVKADRILSEPATSDVALKALSAINLGLNNLNSMITNIVQRLDAAAKEHQINAQVAAAGSASGAHLQQTSQQQQQQRTGVGELPLARFRMNLQQLGQQFHSALNASSAGQHPQLGPLMRQKQQQIQQLLSAAAAAVQNSTSTTTTTTNQQQQQPVMMTMLRGAQATN